MSSVGQALGYVGGAVIGSFFGMPMLGAAIGGMVGSAIDPPKGPNIVGPKLDDLSFQSSTLGAPLARGYGTFPVLGNVIWLEGDKYSEVTTTEEQGGKGGPTQTVEQTTYYATFAVSLLRVTDPAQTVSLRKLWIGSNLVYDAGSDNLESTIASNLDEGVNFTFYSGSDDQLPNPRWQADKGINAVSGMPGRCYIVIEDLNLTAKYSNSLAMAQVKAELSITSPTVDCDKVADLPRATSADRTWPGSVIQSPSLVQYALLAYDYWTQNPVAIEVHEYRPMESSTRVGTRNIQALGWGNTPLRMMICQANIPCAAVMQQHLSGPTYVGNDFTLITLDESYRSDIMTSGEVGYLNYIAAVEQAADVFTGITTTNTWIVSHGSGGKLHRFEVNILKATSVATIRATAIGYSENYVFCLTWDGAGNDYGSEVKRYEKETLALDATYTVTAAQAKHLSVVSDDFFYVILQNGNAVRFVSGVEGESIGVITKAPNQNISFGINAVSVFSESPLYSSTVSIDYGDDAEACEYWIGHHVVPAEIASLRDIVTAECGLAGIASADLDLTALTNSDVRGYRITERGSVRAALEPLQAAFPFDVAQSGYKLRFVSRGGSSVATIPEEDLGTVAIGEQAAVLLPVAREMDTQLPRKVSVRYLDVDREYDLGEQYAERPCNSVNERVVELPIAMNSQEAARTADVLLSKDWIERTELGPFSLPPTWLALEAADVVTVEHRGQSRTVRLTRAEYLPDGRISCNAKLTASQCYTSTATGEAPAVIGQSLVPLRGSTSATLLDIPRIIAAQDGIGLSFGMIGLASGWPGGVLLNTPDNGNTWPVVAALNSRCRKFVAGAAISAHHGYSIDHGSTLTVTPAYAAEALYSITEDQLYAGSNLAAYGVDGRWEIVAFKTAADNGDDFTLKDFLRGLYGTEWASGLHEAGDLLILLDQSTIGFFTLPSSAIGVPRTYRAITQGASIDSTADFANTYNAINLKPLSPVDLTGNRNPNTFDWTISWSRRTRSAVALFAGVDVPIGEGSELYDVEIWDSGYTTLKRTFADLTSQTATYTAAQQVTDFSANQTTLHVRVYQKSPSIGRGFVLQQSITRNIAADPYIDQVTVLMHMEDTGLSDVMGSTITLYGNAGRSATQAKAGTYSAGYDGSGDYIKIGNSSRIDFGTGDFTIETWRYFSDTSNRGIFHYYPGLPPGTVDGLGLGFDGTSFQVYANNTSYPRSFTLTTGSFLHIALVRNSGSLTLWVDGNQLGASITDTRNFTGSNDLWLGLYYSSSYTANGYEDEFRVTKAARYTSAFTPPATPFPDP